MMTELNVSYNYKPEQQYQNRLERENNALIFST